MLIWEPNLSMRWLEMYALQFGTYYNIFRDFKHDDFLKKMLLLCDNLARETKDSYFAWDGALFGLHLN